MLNPYASSNYPPGAAGHQPFVYTASRLYADTLPYTGALATGLLTPGSRTAKVNAGADSLVYWLGFRQADRLYQSSLQRFYDKHPRFAEAVNNHPILLGAPMLMLGVLVGDTGGIFGVRLFQMLWRRANIQEKLTTILHGPAGDDLARRLTPLEKIANHTAVKLGVAVATLALAAGLLIRWFRDMSGFSQDYQRARKDIPYRAMSPYDLKKAVLQNRLAASAIMNESPA
jgi:hypothetical protein